MIDLKDHGGTKFEKAQHKYSKIVRAQRENMVINWNYFR